jgi:flavodoxin
MRFSIKGNDIFYFSSTGNSVYIAKSIKAVLGGEIRYIPIFSGNVDTYDKIIIVYPVYSYGLPIPVYDFIAGMSTHKPI